MVTLILTLTMCALLFLMIWSATYFYPWTGLLRFFPKDIEEKARLHQPPFPAAPVIGWILMRVSRHCLLRHCLEPGSVRCSEHGRWYES